MKKVLLTAMAILTLASASAFGMYGPDKDWIDFLVHANQFRARMNQLGFTLGNGTIKGTFGFDGDTDGVIMEAVSGNKSKDDNWAILAPTISMGIGYTSPVFGIGVGYNYTFLAEDFGIHTPVLTVNALNDNLRIAVPIQIGIAANSDHKNTYLNSYLLGGSTYFAEDYTSVSMDPQIRYYTGIDAVSHIRLTLWYGMATYKPSIATIEEQIASSFGLEFRIHFLKSTVGNVVVDPFFRFTYKTAIDGNNTDVTAGYVGSFVDKGLKDYDKPYLVMFEIPVGLNASSDIVTLYLEPRLGYSFSGKAGAKGDAHDPSINHSLVWGAYGEIYITPVKDLEWYFEADVGSYTSTMVEQNIGVLSGYVDNAVNFAASTGITWYLPSFNGAE